MDLKDEYKKEIKELSPDEAAAERIRQGVAERLARQPKAAPKNPLPLKGIAIIGASSAACLIIGVTVLFSSLTNKWTIGEALGGNDMNAAGNPAPEINGGKNSDENHNTIDGDNANYGNTADPDSVTAPGSDDPADAAPVMIMFDSESCTVFFEGKERKYKSEDSESADLALSSGTEYIPAFSENGKLYYLVFDGEGLMVFDEKNSLSGIYRSIG